MTVTANVEFGRYMGRLSALFALLVLILAMIGIRVWQTSNRFVAEDTWVAHTLEVKNATQTVLARLGGIQAAATVYAATGAPLRAAEFTVESPQLDTDLAALAKLVQENPEQKQRVIAFSTAVQVRQDLLAEAVAARRQTGKLPRLPENAPTDAHRVAASIIAAEDALLSLRREQARNTARLTRTLTASAVLLSIGFLALMFWLIRNAHRRTAISAHELRAANTQLADALNETRRSSSDLQHLNQFGEMLQACHTLDEVRAGIPDAMQELLPGIGGRVALLNPSQNLLSVGAHWGDHGVIAESIFAPEDCWALRRGQAYPLAGTSGGFVCQHVHWPNPDLPDAGYLCIPLTAQGEVIGVMTVDANRSIDANSRRLAIAAAEQLALALANLRLQETLRTQSIRDPLTGLFNRRYLEVSLERELARAARRNHPMAVLMLDLDHFKRFNDSHGHDAGDTLLVQFADVLKRNTRSEDIACRYGGEEFTILLPEVDADSARKRAERIRNATAEMIVKLREQPLERISVSIGLAIFPDDARNGIDLLRNADAALYRAKRAGRNRIMTVDDDKTASGSKDIVPKPSHE